MKKDLMKFLDGMNTEEGEKRYKEIKEIFLKTDKFMYSEEYQNIATGNLDDYDILDTYGLPLELVWDDEIFMNHIDEDFYPNEYSNRYVNLLIQSAIDRMNAGKFKDATESLRQVQYIIHTFYTPKMKEYKDMKNFITSRFIRSDGT